MNLEAVYPNPNDPNDEMSFEELRAKARGWADRVWVAETKQGVLEDSASQRENRGVSSMASGKSTECPVIDIEPCSSDPFEGPDERLNNIIDEEARSQKNGRPKKMKIREVKAETQTSIAPSLT